MALSWKQRLAVVSGNTMEFYDIAVFAAISPFIIEILSKNGYNQASTMVWGMFALRFLLRPIGGVIVGKIADKYSKRTALILTSSLTGTATLSMALLPVDIHNVAFYFLLFQMIQAFSFGGEYPTIINYLITNSHAKETARTSSMIVASSIVGVLFSLAIVESLKMVFSSEQMQLFGWRIPLLIGGVNIAVSFWFRYRLPKEEKAITPEKRLKPTRWVTLFLISVCGAVVFYIQNLSGSILQNSVNIPQFPLINSTLLLILILLSGYLTDKMSKTMNMFKFGCIIGALLYIPSYWLLGHASTIIAGISMLVITALSAIILANLASVLAQLAKDQTVTLGLCYNIALSIFGGLSPLIVDILSKHDTSFVGLYAALCVLPALISIHFFVTKTSPTEFE